MGDCVFGQMANTLVRVPVHLPIALNEKLYQRWKREYTWQTLKATCRYGQSFCDTFGIVDNILYFERNPECADTIIRARYVV